MIDTSARAKTNAISIVEAATIIPIRTLTRGFLFLIKYIDTIAPTPPKAPPSAPPTTGKIAQSDALLPQIIKNKKGIIANIISYHFILGDNCMASPSICRVLPVKKFPVRSALFSFTIYSFFEIG